MECGELEGKRKDLTADETQDLFHSLRAKGSELSYWLTTVAIESGSGVTKLLHRARRKAMKVVRGL